MSERCPLVGMVWDDKIPNFCSENCGDIWEQAEATGTPEEDLIDKDCDHELQFGGATLNRGRGSERLRTILSECVVTGNDVLNETYSFSCPRK